MKETKDMIKDKDLWAGLNRPELSLDEADIVVFGLTDIPKEKMSAQELLKLVKHYFLVHYRLLQLLHQHQKLAEQFVVLRHVQRF